MGKEKGPADPASASARLLNTNHMCLYLNQGKLKRVAAKVENRV
jgi:hypothetical protein